MANFDINLKASELGKSLDDISDRAKNELSGALGGLVDAIYGQGIIYAQQRLKTTRLQYLENFHYQKAGDNLYVIYLDDEANYLEDGFAGFSMIPGLVNGPKSKPTKDGMGRYNTVPIRHSVGSQQKTNMAQMELQQNLIDTIKRNKLGKTFKHPSGQPMQGVVARVKGNDLAQNLQGLVKVQKTYEKATQSYYMTFRRVSTKTDPTKWRHPGWKAAHIFDDLENFTDRKIEEILQAIL